MSYPVLLTLHLFGAVIFVGIVFFEVLILEGVRGKVSATALHEVETAIGKRARRLMPWILLALYGAGAGMAWTYRAVFVQPFASAFATLLCLKIALAVSVLLHFICAVTWMARGQMTARRFRTIHYSVFGHMIAIMLLAKAMLHVSW